MPRILFSRTFWTAIVLVFAIAVFFFSSSGEAASSSSPPNPVIALIVLVFIVYFAQYVEMSSAISNAQYSRAIEIAERLKKLAPRTSLSIFALAHAGMRQGEAALNYANKAIEMSPRNAHFFAIRALARIVLHDFENALADCSKAIELDASSAYAFTLKAECLLLMNNVSGGEKARKTGDLVRTGEQRCAAAAGCLY